MYTNLSFMRKNTIVKVVSLLLIQTFLFYNIGFTAPAGSIAYTVQKDALAPYVISQLMSNPQALEKLIEYITGAEGDTSGDAERLKERIKEAKLEWIREYVRPDLEKLQGRLAALDIGLDQEFYQKLFFRGIELGVKEMEGKLPGERKGLVDDIEELAKGEIGKLFEERGTSSGTGAMREELWKVNVPYTDEEHLDAINPAIRDTINEEGGVRAINNDIAGCIFVVMKDKVYEKHARKHGAPLDLICHPGTHKTRSGFDPDNPEKTYAKVRKYYYIKESLFRKLTMEERLVVAMHEEMHVKIALGLIKVPEEFDSEEEYINSIPSCDVRSIIADKLGSVAYMREFLMTDTAYGDAAKTEILRLEKEGRYEEAKTLIRKVYKRRRNINRMKRVLAEEPYQGYDVIIISSTTEEEAAYQKQALEKALHSVYTQNEALNNKVCIISVVDDSEGGQIIGQVNTWVKAVEEFKKWAHDEDIHDTPLEADDLDELFRSGMVKPAIYHNGGKGERASPATQSLGNSRGAQKLGGTIFGTKDETIELELILSVVLETSPMAISNNSTRIDTFWANQLAFGTVDHTQLKRSNYAFDKFVVRIPDNPKGKDLYDYGSAILSDEGKIIKFLANKVLTKKNPQGQYEPNPDYRTQYDELMRAGNRVFDYGSFSMSREMHYALMEYWRDVKGIFKTMEENGGKAGVKRDIEPALVQILVPLVNGLNGRDLTGILPTIEDLDRCTPDEKSYLRERVYTELLSLMDKEFGKAVKIIYKKDKQPVHESIEFFIRYRNVLFRDMDKVFGNIDLGEDSHWMAYKRLLDMANEKFLMLSDILGRNTELKVDGEIDSTPASAEDKIKAEDLRRMRRIRRDAVAVFEVNGQKVSLTLEEVMKGVEVHGVFVQGSIIHGKCTLEPGSRIINSFVNDSQGKIFATNSYVESSTVPGIEAANSIVYKAVDKRVVKADREIVADAYRPQIKDERFPDGQTRMRGPVGYDPKPGGEKQKVMSDFVVFGDNKYPFQEIREMPCNRTQNDLIEDCLRVQVMVRYGMRGALDVHLTTMTSQGRLTSEFVDKLLFDLKQNEPDSRTRTEILYLCNLLLLYGDETVKHNAAQERNNLLRDMYKLGPSIDPNIYRRDSVRAVADLELPDTIMKAAGAAYVKVLALKLKKNPSEITIPVGRESRESGERILAAFVDGAVAAGARVIDTTDSGMILTSTPLMYFASRYLVNDRGMPVDGIVEVTASHLPRQQNGLKPTLGPVNFTTSEMKLWLSMTHDMIDAKVYEEEVTDEQRAQNVMSAPVLAPYHVLLAAALQGSDEWLGYVEAVQKGDMTLRQAIDNIRPQTEAFMATKPLAGMTFAADSGFGSMGPIIRGILADLGANLEDIGPEADYAKASHDANPNNPDNLVYLLDKVKDIAASLGMAFDVDGDRLGVVTLDGKKLRGDDISCIIAPVVIRQAIERAAKAGIENFKPIIVLNVLCSDRLKKVITKAGGIPIECAVGFNKVKEAMVSPYELYLAQYPEMKGKPEITPDQTAEMGIEISSHIMFKENFNADDAFFAVIKLLGILTKEAEKIRHDKREVPGNLFDMMLDKLGTDHHTGEWRTPMVSNEARIEVTARMREHYERMAQVHPLKYRIRNTLDGLKVDFLKDGNAIGFLAVRPSGTSPEMVIAINSLDSKDAFNLIKNNYFAQMQRFSDHIKWEKDGRPALEPELYYEQAHAFAFEKTKLPVSQEFQAGFTDEAESSRPVPKSSGTGAMRLGEVDQSSASDDREGKLPAKKTVVDQADLFTNHLGSVAKARVEAGEVFVIAIDDDLGEIQAGAMTPITQDFIRELENMTDEKGEKLFPKLVVKRGSGTKGTLSQGIQSEISNGAKKNNVFLVTRRQNLEKGVFKKLDAAWITGINDEQGRSMNYLPVLEAITLMMMSALDINSTEIKKLYDAIARFPIPAEILEDYIVNRKFYILPKITRVQPKELREFYETVRRIYLAA